MQIFTAFYACLEPDNTCIVFLPRDLNTHGMVHYVEFGARCLKFRAVSLGVDRTVLTSLALPKAMHAHTTVAGVVRQSR